MQNPWIAKHQDDEMAFVGGEYTAAISRQLVAKEFAGTDEFTTDCPCGGKLYYRATVGALMCPDCRTLARTDGTIIRNGAR